MGRAKRKRIPFMRRKSLTQTAFVYFVYEIHMSIGICEQQKQLTEQLFFVGPSCRKQDLLKIKVLTKFGSKPSSGYDNDRHDGANALMSVQRSAFMEVEVVRCRAAIEMISCLFIKTLQQKTLCIVFGVQT